MPDNARPQRIDELTPRKIVEELDRYIVGQKDAKKAVAVAMRNRYRRERLPDAMKEDVIPKNILMIGPTGVGKTEIARRLAKLVDAPFLKVEATKYTEVGYVGRDVESMIRDLVEIGVRMVGAQRFEGVKEKAEELAVERIVSLLKPRKKNEPMSSPLSMIFGGMQGSSQPQAAIEEDPETQSRAGTEREELRQKIQSGELDDRFIEIEVEESLNSVIEVFSGTGMEEMGVNFQDMLGGLLPKKRKKRNIRIGEARKVLAAEEAKKLIDIDEVKRDAITRVEQYAIVFIDELDKIAGREKGGGGPDVSREGVQRDILPIVEGSTVNTKYGPVRTDHILFMAAGAFHVAKPSDLIPELQGRFPIRVELTNLTQEDFRRILIEPQNALIKQYTALLSTENVEIVFTEDAIDEIARLAQLVNEQTENIGARRLHTVLEKVLEELSYAAPEVEPRVIIDREYVRTRLEDIVKNEDLSRFIL